MVEAIFIARFIFGKGFRLDILVVGAGGSLGAILRFMVSTVFARRFGTRFPYGTFFINVSGSFILGLFLTLAAQQIMADQVYRWLIAVGFCGGYTTFSTYTYETLTMVRERRLLVALLANFLGSYLLGLLGALAGVSLANWLVR